MGAAYTPPRPRDSLATRYRWGGIVLLACGWITTAHSTPDNKNTPLPTSELRIIFDDTLFTPTQESDALESQTLQLLSSLTPPEVNLRIWRLGTRLEELAPILPIHKRAGAQKKAPPLSATALFEALEVVSSELQQSKIPGDHNIIVVTRGLPNGDMEQQEERLTLLSQRLWQEGIRLYVVVYAPTHEQLLLSQLATLSSGDYQIGEDRKSMERLLRHTLEQLTHPDYLSLNAGLIKIDERITAATLLINKKKPADKIQLITPTVERFDATRPPSNVTWHATPLFDVIHITQPKLGTWQLQSNNIDDIENRLFVTTDLKIIATPLAPQLAVHAFNTLHIELYQAGEKIKDAAILKYTALSVVQREGRQTRATWFPTDSGKEGDLQEGDGTFTTQLKETLTEGRYEIVIDVDAKKFQRQYRYFIRVSNDVAWINHRYSDTEKSYIITVTPRPDVININTLVMNATLQDENGVQHDAELSAKTPLVWELTVDNSVPPKIVSVELNIAGSTPQGNTISVWLPAITLQEKPRTVTPPPSSTAINTNNALGAVVIAANSSKIANDDVMPEKTTALPLNRALWDSPWAPFISINLVVLLIVGLIYQRWRKMEQAWRTQLEAKLRYD